MIITDPRIKPCPCCKGVAKLDITDRIGDNHDYMIFCTNCALRSQARPNLEDTIAIWNTRPTPPRKICANCVHFDEDYDNWGWGECDLTKDECTAYNHTCPVWMNKDD